MYSILDYAYNGCLYLNNVMRPRHKRLSQLMIYATTACQSQCKHCNIWKKKVEHLSIDDIQQVMESRCVTRHTTVGLEGGEFILHPQVGEIMAWFQEHHPNYTLLSNCLAPRRVIKAVRLHHPRHLYFNEIQAFVDAVEGHGNNVVSSIEATRDAYMLIETIKQRYS